MRRALSREDPHVGNRRHQNTGCRGPTIRWGIMTAELVVPTRRVASAPRVQVGRIVVIDVLRGIALFGMLVAHAHPLLPPGARGADLVRDGSAQRHRLTPLRPHDGDLGPAPGLPHPAAIVGGAAGAADRPRAHPDRPRTVAGVVGDVGRRRAGVPRRAPDRRGAAAVPAHDSARHRGGGGRARECAAQQLGGRRLRSAGFDLPDAMRYLDAWVVAGLQLPPDEPAPLLPLGRSADARRPGSQPVADLDGGHRRRGLRRASAPGEVHRTPPSTRRAPTPTPFTTSASCSSPMPW